MKGRVSNGSVFHMVEVGGSIPAPPIMNLNGVPGHAVPFLLFMAGCLNN